MRDPRTTAQVAASAVIGGAAAIRVQGIADIQFTRAAVEVPVIGLWKDGHDGVFITPTLRHALAWPTPAPTLWPSTAPAAPARTA